MGMGVWATLGTPLRGPPSTALQTGALSMQAAIRYQHLGRIHTTINRDTLAVYLCK